jgi:fatty acid desaturase
MSDLSKKSTKEMIPGSLNLSLSLTVMLGLSFLLWYAAHTGSTLGFIGAIIAFSYLNNTAFSLLHEAVHGLFHPNRAINEGFGRLLAAFFPTGFIFQRIAHLGHHRRNRTEAELFDYYRPSENLLVKYLQWYGILTGLYWLLPPLSALLFLFCPTWLLKRIIDFSEASQLAQQTSAEGMLSGYRHAPWAKMKLEILFSLLIQAGLFYLLDLNLVSWLACYAAFGFNWSSLQYTDHAFSERDVYEGAWNLRVNKIVQYIFLNYHHHKAHHLYPHVPWLYLEQYVNFAEKRPAFMEIYLKMWAGPRPLPETEAATPEPRPLALPAE